MRTAAGGYVTPARGARSTREERAVGLDDKVQHQATDAKGKAKEATGAVTGDEDMKAEGRGDQAQATAEEAGRHLKEAAKDAKDTLKP
jgi:uncharacterized protein YjbJ (UPF0337 family)